ncbi:TonB-dependent receptor plug domain-containing protein [Portibacter marinus]|uniref:TonB-dependent receptor plug domain-containing protein n=1 Tax=Portibacter marinus TaxID=2898660 RepID=UPI001F444FEF|nr:TonB-dependent receptor plug domain-containing protein [Portibacter marinus]
MLKKLIPGRVKPYYVRIAISKSIISLLFLLSMINSLQSQEKIMETMLENLDSLTILYPQTKIYVHTDKPYYSVGDHIWYAVYAINANDHQNLPLSELMYVTLEDAEGHIVIQQNLKLNGKRASGDIAVDLDWSEGIYTLKAFTSYMRNFDSNYIFSKEIAIYSKEESGTDVSLKTSLEPYQIRFFPEGGDLIAGLNTKIAFELIDTTIQEIAVLNGLGDQVATGKVVQNGLGIFNLIPEIEEKYYVILGEEKFALPKVKPAGYTLKVNTLSEDKIYLDVIGSKGKSLENTFIIGHIRGTPFLTRDGLEGQKVSMVLDKSSIPEGVSQITLFDDQGRPLTERTFFIRHQQDDLQVVASIPYEYLNKRQKAEISVELSGTGLGSGDGTFSISVVDSKSVQGLKKGVNIKSYLLLGSEFTTGIEHIHQYFETNSPRNRFKLDLLMLTRGWTRFTWEDIRMDKKPEIQFPPENGFTISGQVFEKNKPVQAQVNFSTVDDDLFFASIPTEEDGSFTALGFDLEANEKINISAYKPGKKEKKITKNISVKVDPAEIFTVSSNQRYRYEGPHRNEVTDYIELSYENQMMDSLYDGMQIELDEVVMTADRKTSRDQKIKKERGIIYTNYDRRVFIDSMPNRRMFTNVFDMVRGQVPGVNIIGTAGNQRFRLRGGSNSIRGSNDALVIVDGVPATYEYVNAINPDQIEFIDVLKGISTSALYGTPNGVVAIYTRMDNGSVSRNYKTPDNIASFLHNGYYQSRKFYSPDYSQSFPGDEKPDLRTTLYWNPIVELEEGKAVVNFFTADQVTEYLIEVQGITEAGLPFVGYDTFEVR